MDIQQIENYILKNGLSEVLAHEDLIHFVRHQLHDFGRLMAFYRCAMMEVETKFNVISEDFTYQYERNPIENIKSRLKEPASIFSKLKRREQPLTVESIEENLFDVAGVRVVCSFVDDVYQIAEALLSQDDVVLIERKDYIQNPKPNGYRSLHLIVAVPIFLTNQKKMMNVEIQLRTIAMDFWASLEHQLRYKKENVMTPDMEMDLKTCAEISSHLDVLMNDLCQKIASTNGSSRPLPPEVNK